jgi:choline dehydrogenase-like flavoprotein
MRTVIVGAGSAGGALAARLTEDPDERVMLIEAGPDFADPRDIPAEVQDTYEMSVDGFDWGLEAYFLEPPEAREAQPYPRGRIVGGSSAVNAAIAQRATVEDIASWEAAGNEEWGWDAARSTLRTFFSSVVWDPPNCSPSKRLSPWSLARELAATCRIIPSCPSSRS